MIKKMMRLAKKPVQKLNSFFKNLVLKERSPKKLAQSFCLGSFIAFSPFLGLHTWMIFGFSWLLGLNTAVTFAAGYLINNPLTMGPIILLDYMVGKWLVNTLLGLDFSDMNPSWMGFINDRLYSYLGMKEICFWTYVIGGNVLGLVVALTLYPLMKKLFERLVRQVYGTQESEHHGKNTDTK